MDVANTINMIVNVLMWVLGAAVFIVAMFFLMLGGKFKNNVIVKEMTSTGKRTYFVKAREVEEDGNTYWKLKNFKGKKFPLMPLPPAKAIDIGDKGSLTVEAYLLPSGEWSFRPDSWNVEDIPKDILKLKRDKPELYEASLKQWREENNVVDARPVTPLQKSVIVSQLKKIEHRKKESIHQLIEKALPYAFLVIMLIMFFAFYEEISQPAAQMADKSLQFADKMEKINSDQAEIISDLKQIIKQNQVIDGKDINNINDEDQNVS